MSPPYHVDITISGDISQVTDAWKTALRTAVATLLGIDVSVIYVTVRAGSVIAGVEFSSVNANQTPQQMATTLSGKTTAELTTSLGVTVESVAAATPGALQTLVPTSAPSTPSGGGGDSDSGTDSGTVAGAVVGVVAGLGLVAGLGYLWHTRRKAAAGGGLGRGRPAVVPIHSSAGLGVSGGSIGGAKSPTVGITAVKAVRVGPSARVAPASRGPALPPNWTQHYDDNGTPYFFNAVTGESRWTPPGSS